MKVPEPRKLKSGTWFIQLRLGGESIPVSALTRSDCIKQAQLIKAQHRADQLGQSGQKALLPAFDGGKGENNKENHIIDKCGRK